MITRIHIREDGSISSCYADKDDCNECNVRFICKTSGGKLSWEEWQNSITKGTGLTLKQWVENIEGIFRRIAKGWGIEVANKVVRDLKLGDLGISEEPIEKS